MLLSFILRLSMLEVYAWKSAHLHLMSFVNRRFKLIPNHLLMSFNHVVYFVFSELRNDVHDMIPHCVFEFGADSFCQSCPPAIGALLIKVIEFIAFTIIAQAHPYLFDLSLNFASLCLIPESHFLVVVQSSWLFVEAIRIFKPLDLLLDCLWDHFWFKTGLLHLHSDILKHLVLLLWPLTVWLLCLWQIALLLRSLIFKGLRAINLLKTLFL